MAKNTSSSAFRKIDVDQYCEDNYKEDEVDQVGPQGPDESEVMSLLQNSNLMQGFWYEGIQTPSADQRKQRFPLEVNMKHVNRKLIDALKIVLGNAPLGSKNQQIKENALNLTLRVLLSIKPSQIEEAVNSLETDHLDVLMKYVYKGFENPSEGSSGHLLVWHEKVYNIGGVGCIVRVLSDTRRV